MGEGGEQSHNRSADGLVKPPRKFWPRPKRKNYKIECLCAWDFKPMRWPRRNQLYCSQVCKQAAFQLRKDLEVSEIVVTKRIAVLSSKLDDTIRWLTDTFKEELALFRRSTNILLLKDGRELRIIQRYEQAVGIEWDEYLRAPDYWTLEDEVRIRIQRRHKDAPMVQGETS